MSKDVQNKGWKLMETPETRLTELSYIHPSAFIRAEAVVAVKLLQNLDMLLVEARMHTTKEEKK